MDDYDMTTTESEDDYGPGNKVIAGDRICSGTMGERQKKENETLKESDQCENESISVATIISPGCCRNGQITLFPQTLGPSKEGSVIEEKEVEDGKQDEATAEGKKLTCSNLQLLCVPYGGARPKEPLSLQISQPIFEQVQNEISTDKTESLDDQNLANCGAELPLPYRIKGLGDFGVVRLNDENRNPSPRLFVPFESPDYNFKAGQQEAVSRKSLGDVAPVWVPDSKAPICMKCEIKFTFTKRRHHCRACGKVFCAACCSLKSKLMYMDRREARVCITCYSTLMNSQSWENTINYPSPSNATESCSDTPRLQQTATEQTSGTQTLATQHFSSRTHEVVQGHRHVGSLGRSISLIPADGLPPILISTGIKQDYNVVEKPSEMVLMQQLEESGLDPLVFILNANLLTMVKLVNYLNRKCWCAITKGMHAVGQPEVVILLQCLPDEKTIPKDIFSHFVQLYREALSGNVLRHLGHSFVTQSFLGSKEHGGFLYINPTFQTLQDLLLPSSPYLFGILIQKWETPWAKIFPIRLMLRLGAEYKVYPCPLFSVRFRKPVFGETGHTIMNLLADFRNYQYTLPMVTGLVVDVEARKTYIKIPKNRYNDLMKALNKSNEHVLAVGACFNEQADSHLVCIQNDDGNYQTQAISINHQTHKVTGACFFVFSGALKASSGYSAKTSIVEDGVMVQITTETMEELRQALKDMKDYSIPCGKIELDENQKHVHIHWTEDDQNFNSGIISPIDGKSMESINCMNIFHGAEYKANGKVIRWTEVFFLQNQDQSYILSDPAEHSRLTESVARAFCMGLCPHLKMLKEGGMDKLGLRVTVDSDQVGYLVGSNGQPLLSQYQAILNDLDSVLIPVIHSSVCQLNEGPVVMELIFYILDIIF
ncbi:zinc finger FYVE domain-containing protein 9-like isoform X2 [Sardina pilchardus]|uniref:zinc finger FYVE domain-containing protein 9-like isoform X2 n=1 Tax=Sardina pilchardus TaxID=27697 RepID=UPI002E0EDE43